MKLRRPHVAFAALLLCACSPQSRSMPDFENPSDVKAAIASLSPYQDGRPAGSDDTGMAPERGSDRWLFKEWAFRYVARNEYKTDIRNWDPIPRSIGEALDEQRAVMERARIADEARQAELDRETAQQKAEAAVATQRLAYEAAEAEVEATRKTEKAARADAEAKLVSDAKAAEDVEHLAAADRQRRASDPAYDCRVRQQEAATAAEAKATQPGTGAYNRAWNSFKCS